MSSVPALQNLLLIRPIASLDVTTKTIPNQHHQHHRPSLEVTGGARDAFLPALKTVPERSYTPFLPIGWNRHVETIFAAFFRSLPDVRLKRECLRTKDNGSVALDWLSGDHQLFLPLILRSSFCWRYA